MDSPELSFEEQLDAIHDGLGPQAAGIVRQLLGRDCDMSSLSPAQKATYDFEIHPALRRAQAARDRAFAKSLMDRDD